MVASGTAILARRILIVDDHPDSAEATSLLLSQLGHICTPVTSGEAALVEAERRRPDLVLCDLGLPGISGYEVARALRDRFGAAIYLAALTGWDQPADRVRALCAGFDQHVVKPATAKVLLSVITSSLCSWRTGGAIGRDPAVG